jgi:membrane protease YdiL (CAAX protease family)
VSLGLAAEGPWLRDLILGVAVSGLLAAGDFATRAGLGWLRVVNVLWPSQRLTEILTGTLAAFALFLLVSWGEELFFRGYFLQNLSEGLGPRWALLFSSLAFALFHGARVGIDFLLLFAGGVYLAFAVLRSQQLWLATGLHAGWNFFRHAVFGYSLGDPFGGQVFRLVDARTVTPQLFPGVSGGDLMYLLSLAIGAAIVYRCTRKTRGLAAIGDG